LLILQLIVDESQNVYMIVKHKNNKINNIKTSAIDDKERNQNA